ncbi:DNA replication complex GINS protein PSF3 [Auxenochlorella protothecoides]|uniref:DNA replication complex GINS protein PSF3 n=2 Tax=Auxenochlorella protothecoides TaxID=3075 RepID=A0A087ST30_AUXPR|nr:DNA replication complex GINS protein PSF3 [Auxenochlorella protothecoides]KFM28884.1 DNA replication complex GINS protein PSF3 [Auxenochlorella protothecoides]
MAQSYYSPLAISAEETLVRVRLEHGCTGVGSVIDPSADGADLAPGSTLDVPLWLASSLAQRGMARVELPVYYGNKMRRKMRAGAGCEDLRVRCPHYYTVAGGLHAAMLAGRTADEGFPEFVMATFRTRYKELLCRATTIDNNVEASALQARLSVEELSLFMAAADAASRHEAWRAGGEASQSRLARSASMKRKWSENQENRGMNTLTAPPRSGQ